MTWLYESQEITEIPEEYAGFVYLITNTQTGRKYIGKKLSKFSKTTYKTERLKNGRKRRKKIKGKIESDWQTYWSSSEELKNDVLRLGEENFTREILRFCKSKTELSYYEAKYQFDYDVLLDESKWYNGWISVKVRKF